MDKTTEIIEKKEEKVILPCGCEKSKCKCNMTDLEYFKKYGAALIKQQGVKALWKAGRAKMKADKEYSKKLKQESKDLIKKAKDYKKASNNKIDN